jgi:nucleoid-associated protein YgaU
MYAIHAQRRARPRTPFADTMAWRARWWIAAVLAVALVGVGYAREAAGSPIASGEAAPATVTVARGDTLWSIASRRYPDADARQKVTEIERLNGLSGPVILPGQHLRVPAR